MKIEFSIEQGVRNNEKIIIINAIKMLTRSKLPDEYIHKGESVSGYKDTIYYTDGDSDRMEDFMQIGGWYYEDYFWDQIAIVKRCAKRLSAINKKLKRSLVETNWSLIEKKIII